MTRRVAAPRGSRDTRLFARAMLVALILGAACAACDASPALADPLESIWRVIMFKGSRLPTLVGGSERHLEVLALHDGRLVPIPFQIDEVLPDGRYALPDGPEPLADDSPGMLDRDDEVAMMLSDLGDRASPPPRELPADAFEIETLDSASDTRRYAYIAAVPSPRLSHVSYVSYDPAENRIDGGSYRMTLRGDFPLELALKDGRGTRSPSIIEGSQVQVTARLLMLFRLRLSSTGLINSVRAWHHGPIRLIRRVSHSVKLTFGIESPRVQSDEIFYRDYAEDSFVARVLWVPRLFFGAVQVRTWLDFVGLGGFALSWPRMEWRPLVPGPGGAALAAEIRDAPPEVKWLALKGGGKIVMQTFTPTPDLATLRRQLYYCDGTAAAVTYRHTSSACAGNGLQIGYLITGWEKLAAGTHRVNSVLMVLPDGAAPDVVAHGLAEAPLVNVRALVRR